MPSLGPAEILVVLVVALLVFGPNKMPEIARQVGKGLREFKRVQQHLKSELRDVVAEFDASSSTTPSVEPGTAPMLPPSDRVDATAPTMEAAPDHPAPPPEPGTPPPGTSADPA
jgi:sec-independent protein translocase protein TatA